MTLRLTLITIFAYALLPSYLQAENDSKEASFSATFKLQYGITGIANHSIQFGKNGTLFDFTREGGQKVTYPFSRFSLELNILQDHLLELIYQPIYIDTNVVLSAEARFDDKVFKNGSSLDTRYYFPFYRLTYLYRFINQESFMLAGGAGIQLRNATIWFSSPDAATRFVTTSLGPVPLLALRTSWSPTRLWSIGAEIAGWWSPIPVLNGGSEPVTGWIYDTALNSALRLNKFAHLFFEARLIGGGAQGDSGKTAGRMDGYTYNNLNLINFSAGLALTLPN